MQLHEVVELSALSSQQAHMPNICNQVKTCNKAGNFGKPLLMIIPYILGIKNIKHAIHV